MQKTFQTILRSNMIFSQRESWKCSTSVKGRITSTWQLRQIFFETQAVPQGREKKFMVLGDPPVVDTSLNTARSA
jgi:hypothetical protein